MSSDLKYLAGCALCGWGGSVGVTGPVPHLASQANSRPRRVRRLGGRVKWSGPPGPPQCRPNGCTASSVPCVQTPASCVTKYAVSSACDSVQLTLYMSCLLTHTNIDPRTEACAHTRRGEKSQLFRLLQDLPLGKSLSTCTHLANLAPAAVWPADSGCLDGRSDPDRLRWPRCCLTSVNSALSARHLPVAFSMPVRTWRQGPAGGGRCCGERVETPAQRNAALKDAANVIRPARRRPAAGRPAGNCSSNSAGVHQSHSAPCGCSTARVLFASGLNQLCSTALPLGVGMERVGFSCCSAATQIEASTRF